eukprot:s502_g4.t1
MRLHEKLANAALAARQCRRAVRRKDHFVQHRVLDYRGLGNRVKAIHLRSLPRHLQQGLSSYVARRALAVAAPAAAEVLGSAVPHSEDCSASGIARLLWCLAKLQEAAQPFWRTADAAPGISVAWAAARLGVFDFDAARALSAAAADPTALRAQERLSGCEDVALSAWTLATWGYEGSEGGLAKFAAAAEQRAEVLELSVSD